MSDYEVRKDRFGNTVIVRLSDGAFIPDDPANRDYRRYLQAEARARLGVPNGFESTGYVI